MPAEYRSVPRATIWLGSLGVLPFFACTLIILIGPSRFDSSVLEVMAAYGAVILSFLGGIRWGFATSGVYSVAENTVLLRRLVVSVAPSLIAWIALLVAQQFGLLLLACSFAVMLVLDTLAVRSNTVPCWYPLLRWPLTVAVIAALLVAAFS
ncbi:MAG: DUF3429 domain-containing protein [Alphaproteobacteria bacterium]|nr:DUF3429 domain-containing protein [Alphaproteobacteria bacterium]